MFENGVEAVNAIFSQRIQTGVANANARESEIATLEADDFCDQDRLYTEIRRAIFQSLFPRWGLRGYDLDLQLRDLMSDSSYALSLQDSIYRDIDHMEGFSLRVKELSDVIMIDGHLIGLDKIGHFFAEGWEYFEIARRNDQVIDEALRWGRRQEAGKFGYATTGVFSFADLTANFNGWRFWNDILRTQDDPLRGRMANIFSATYVACRLDIASSLRYRKPVRTWRLTKRFDFSDYVDGAWDEGNNCNSYADPVIEAKVLHRISEVSPGFRCPVEPEECAVARQKYGRFAKHLLHPSCLTLAAGRT